jgi:hypothetical protein
MSLQEHSQKPSTPSLQEKSARKRPVSERRIQANRRNALRSTGPKTERGKRTVARNAIKYGLLAREVVITAGDGEENLEEFHSLVDRLWESYEPVGVVEESLIQTIAICWWRKARVLRAENGEIRKRLDTISVDRALRNSDNTNLVLAVSDLELGFFRPNEIPLMEQWAAIQHAQTTLRTHRPGPAFLRSLLEEAKSGIASEGYMSETIRKGLFLAFCFWDYPFAIQMNAFRPPETKADNGPCGVADDKEGGGKRAAVVASIDYQLERINSFMSYALEREELTADAEARSFSLPADATDKLLRYEAHLDRQLYRAMDQLERLQRQRRGENVPPPLNINLGKRS